MHIPHSADEGGSTTEAIRSAAQLGLDAVEDVISPHHPVQDPRVLHDVVDSVVDLISVKGRLARVMIELARSRPDLTPRDRTLLAAGVTAYAVAEQMLEFKTQADD